MKLPRMRGVGTLLLVCLATSFQPGFGNLEVGLPLGGGLYILRMHVYSRFNVSLVSAWPLRGEALPHFVLSPRNAGLLVTSIDSCLSA